MNQTKGTDVSQVMYQGRWVSRNHFRVFVYKLNEQKLANSYDEYEKLIESGLWFSSKEDIKDIDQPAQDVEKPVKRPSRKPKNGADS